MATVMCLMTLLVPVTTTQCGQPSRGGQAIKDWRGGEALEKKEPVGDVSTWICIHNHEGAWNDPNDPYWGGLQMDRNFMLAYGRDMVRKYGGWADLWSPRDQMVVAERARKLRGYGPWPMTRIPCGV